MRFIFRGLLAIIVLVLAAYLLRDVLDQAWVDRYVRDRGLAGEVLFVGICALLAGAGLSRQVIAFLAGYGFGFSQGVLLAMLAVVTGCIITFSIARLFLRGFLLKRYSERIRRVDEFIRENTFSMTLLIRLLPLGSNWMFNIAAGVSGVRSLPFFLGSALGYLPQMMIFSLVGGGARVDQFWQIAIAIAMLVVAVVLGAYLYRKYLKDRTPGLELESKPVTRNGSTTR
ncbi:MAG: TVP38/TMEM64 family protein [Gammaproteobacteria bacterium]|nr:TVP38/TMEM64 family protein [Gammaproteobacteria bacterium]